MVSQEHWDLNSTTQPARSRGAYTAAAGEVGPAACLPQVSPPALSPYGDRLLSLKGVIRKWKSFKNTAIKNNKNNRAGTYVSLRAHHLLLAWIEVFCHQSVTAC